MPRYERFSARRRAAARLTAQDAACYLCVALASDERSRLSMSSSLTRAQLFSRTAKAGAALLVAGSARGQFVGTAAADPLPDGDLACARLLVATELLAIDYTGQPTP